MSIAVITDPDWGWLTVRIRWKRHLPKYLGETAWFDLENFGGWEGKTPYARRLKWLRSALEGRRAAKAAYAAGHRQMLVATLQYAPLFPLHEDVRYYLYGDATPWQYDTLYCDELDDRPRKRWMRARYRRLAERGHHMLCMSPWFRDGLIERYGVKTGQTTILRPPIDTDLWKVSKRESQSVLNILFIGGDFQRKGGGILLDLSQDGRFEACRWHFLTNHVAADLPNCVFHRGISADTPQQRAIVESCDLMILPTKADCSPHAAIEAGAAGLPCVITDVGGISDIVETRVNGTLLSSREPREIVCAVLDYLDDPARLVGEGGEARRRVEERNSIPIHMSILKELLG